MNPKRLGAEGITASLEHGMSRLENATLWREGRENLRERVTSRLEGATRWREVGKRWREAKTDLLEGNALSAELLSPVVQVAASPTHSGERSGEGQTQRPLRGVA